MVFIHRGFIPRVECREWIDGQIGNNDSANDVRDVDLRHAHMLSGPIFVEGAEPGDLLVVDILDLGPVPQEVGEALARAGLHRNLRQGQRRRLPDRPISRCPTTPARENGGMETYGVTTNPILMPGNAEPWYSEFVTFIGIGVDRDTDTQLYGDATIASAMPV